MQVKMNIFRKLKFLIGELVPVDLSKISQDYIDLQNL